MRTLYLLILSLLSIFWLSACVEVEDDAVPDHVTIEQHESPDIVVEDTTPDIVVEDKTPDVEVEVK